MKITGLSTRVVNAEMRNWVFVRVETDSPGLFGWGEATLEWKTRAVVGAVEDLAPLLIGRDPRDRKRMAVVGRGGKAALTHYQVVKNWGAAVSMVECHLATGRTHQIRVHLGSAGYPIVGDPVYLRRVPLAARALAEPARSHLLDFPRQALHAASLGFRHPRSGAMMLFTAPLPADYAGLILRLDAGG